MSAMTDRDLIIAVAKLDGWVEACTVDRHGNKFYRRIEDKQENGKEWRRFGDFPKSHKPLPPYLTCRDAIIPVIEKQNEQIKNLIQTELSFHYQYIFLADAKQLAIALVKATGGWKE